MRIYLDEEKLHYDIFELVRTFVPREEICFSGEEDLNLVIEYKNRKASLYKEDKKVELSVPYIEEAKLQRRAFKRAVLKLLEGYYKKTSPWGILTGIRPVKIVQELMDQKKDREEILERLTKEYSLYKEKADLLYTIACRQRPYLYPIKEDSYSLYINIPFCPTRCDYCSFPTILYKKRDYRKDYIKTLLREMEAMGKVLKDKKLETVYIGGGTPTSLEKEDLTVLLEGVKEDFGLPVEWTVEAGREDTLSKEVFFLLKEKGVTRISLNPQSFHDKTLKKIGRLQNNDRLIRLYEEAKEIGFDCINMDFILGLPGEGMEDLEYNLRKIKELMPENLTIHTLSVKRGSKFMERQENLGGERDLIGDMLERVHRFIAESPYEAYYLYRQKQILGNHENVGYALPGKENLYNMYMMEERQTVIGLGMTSNSKILYPNENRIENYRNYKNIRDYQNKIDEIIEKKSRLIKGV